MAALTVRVVNGAERPLVGARVACAVLGGVLGVADTHDECYTDGEGVARFEDLAEGIVHVYVEGRRACMLRVARYDRREVTIHV